MRSSVTLTAILLTALPILAQNGSGGSAESTWKKLDFLMGKWTGAAGAKDTPHGAGHGGFSFQPELNGKIIVRRNFADYDTGVHHEDLMTIYLDGEPAAPHAIYFDTEGHTIRYKVTFPAPDRVVFESEGAQSGPRYRLTYWLDGATLDGKFEVAPPGVGYKTYLSWTSKRE